MSKVAKKTFIYLRCSTDVQSTDSHIKEIKSYCTIKGIKIKDADFYRDQGLTGDKPWKSRKIFEIVNEAKEGDNIIVSELSRLGRRQSDLIEILTLCKDKKIVLHAIKENYVNDGSIQATMIFGIMSTMAQVEREMNQARTMSAMATMKANGVKFGRGQYSVLNSYENKIKKDFKTMTVRELANKYKVTFMCMNKYLERHDYFGISKEDIVKVPKSKMEHRRVSIPSNVRKNQFDENIDLINEELGNPHMTLQAIAVKHGWNPGAFRSYVKRRSTANDQL
jgi:DNA invertase Pin-like site-specific DNA recombinase